MWLFSRPDKTPTAAGLEERVAALEKRMAEVDIEWSEWFDKYRRLYARLAKRVERDEKVEDHAANGAPSRENGSGPTNYGHAGVNRVRNLRGF